MSVNRRYSKRHPVNFVLYIHYRDKRIFPAQAKNLSIHGMFIQTNSLTLPKGNLVDLEFSLSDTSWQIPAVVVHSSPAGLGVMFRKPQPALERCSHVADESSYRPRQPQIVFPESTKGHTEVSP